MFLVRCDFDTSLVRTLELAMYGLGRGKGIRMVPRYTCLRSAVCVFFSAVVAFLFSEVFVMLGSGSFSQERWAFNSALVASFFGLCLVVVFRAREQLAHAVWYLF